MVEIKIDLEKCNGCGTCIDTCPAAVFELQEEKCVVIDIDECLACRACEAQCPNVAIEIIE
jgi:NAD-dependent dihydropyrimidine dehydrogenase PreA subunit